MFKVTCSSKRVVAEESQKKISWLLAREKAGLTLPAPPAEDVAFKPPSTNITSKKRCAGLVTIMTLCTNGFGRPPLRYILAISEGPLRVTTELVHCSG